LKNNLDLDLEKFIEDNDSWENDLLFELDFFSFLNDDLDFKFLFK
jgi:hypothetical protein